MAASSSQGPDLRPITRLTAADENAAIRAVVIYEDRAEVTRNIKVSLPPGEHEVVLEGLSDKVVEESFRVNGGTGAATVLEVAYETRWEKEELDETAVGRKRKELEELRAQVRGIEATLARIRNQENWMSTYSGNVAKLPATEGVDIKSFFDPDLAKNTAAFLDFYGDRLRLFDEEKAKCNDSLKDLNERIDLLNKESGKTRQPKSIEKREVSILLTVSGEGSKERDLTLELKYLCHGASWSASYDVRVERADKVCEFTYYGEVKNNTGEDWREIELSLSTARPSIGGAPPMLPTATVDFAAPAYRSQAPMPKGKRRGRNASICMDDMMVAQMASFAPLNESESSDDEFDPESELDEDEAANLPMGVLTAQPKEGSTSTTFTVQRAASVASDDKPHKQTIAIVHLAPRFTFLGTPKMSPHVYLKCSTRNTSALPFLAGKTSIFIDSNFVAHSTLKFVGQNEEFSFFLGVDDAVKIDYKPEVVKKDTKGSGLMSAKVNTETREQITIIKNTKAEEIAFVLMDQLPRTSDSKIVVQLLEPDLKKQKANVKINAKNNLEWRYAIPAGEEMTFRLAYRVEFPKDKKVDIQYHN